MITSDVLANKFAAIRTTLTERDCGFGPQLRLVAWVMVESK